jgi:uncharacterized protein YuzE
MKAKEAMRNINLSVSIETDNATGTVIAVYFQIRSGKARTTREYEGGKAFADYNHKGELIGIELLAPCSVTVVDQLAADEPAEFRKKAKKFMRESGPASMIKTAA